MKKIYNSICIIITLLAFSISAKATIHSITVEDFAFRPASLNVFVGDTIVWTWVSGDHTVTVDALPVGAAVWDVIMDFSTPDFQYIVTMPGFYSYHCIPHQLMGMAGSFSAIATTGIGTTEKEKFNFTVHQNSFDKSLLLKINTGNKFQADFKLMDISGCVVYSISNINAEKGSVSRLNPGYQARGIYLAELRSGSVREVTRIILD